MLLEIIGKKMGMTQLFDEEANLIGVTLIEVEPVCLLEEVEYTNKKKMKIGCFRVPENRLKKVRKPQLGYFAKLGVPPYSLIREVDYTPTEDMELKKEIGIEMFSTGEVISVRAKSKGRGFQGGMKRHGWSGGPKTHGSMTHRRIGSAGATTFPGRVIKGHRMPGHMGNNYVTVKNLKIVRIDKEKKILFVRGAVPGAMNNIVFIRREKVLSSEKEKAN